MIAEESTSWPGVTPPGASRRPRVHLQVEHGLDARHARLLQAGSDLPQVSPRAASRSRCSMRSRENFILPFSHDEVVHGKGSMLDKMPGDVWQKHATLRALYGYMFTHPGKKLLFMGGEIAQWREWNHDAAARLGSARRSAPRRHAALGARSQSHLRVRSRRSGKWTSSRDGFSWIDCHDHENSVISFVRRADDPDDVERDRRQLHAAAAPRLPHRRAARRRATAKCSTATPTIYGGSNVSNGRIEAVDRPSHGYRAFDHPDGPAARIRVAEARVDRGTEVPRYMIVHT